MMKITAKEMIYYRDRTEVFCRGGKTISIGTTMADGKQMSYDFFHSVLFPNYVAGRIVIKSEDETCDG